MGGFSFGFGGDRGLHFDAFSSSSSGSGSTSRRDHRSRRDSSPVMEGPTTMFGRMMDEMSETMSGFGFNGPAYHTRERLPERGRSFDSAIDTGDFTTSAYSGFPGMPRGRRRSSVSSFDSDKDTIRPSGYSRFPGMPVRSSSSYQTEGSRFVERSEPFFMRRSDSSSRSRRHRSPSPPASTSFSSKGYRTTERAPESTWASGAHRTASPPRYHPGYPYSDAGYPYQASSPPRRHRSPSPVGRTYGPSRHRSPSPPRHGRSGRSDSARGFRTTERKPEGASSRTAGSSSHERGHARAGAERPSANQYNGYGQSSGGYYGGNSQSYGTSYNAYNTRPETGSRSHSSSRNASTLR